LCFSAPLDAEISNLNKYMVAGGLHIDDNYGPIHPKRNKKIFPNNALIEIPSNHILFQNLSFPVDCPKSMNMTESDRRPTVFS
jgi:hypothetical protein